MTIEKQNDNKPAPLASGRIVEITDEDENILVAFVPVERGTSFTDKPNHHRKEKLP